MMSDKNTIADSGMGSDATIADRSATLVGSSISNSATVAEARLGTASSEWEIGDVIMDTYEVTGVLGAGGMGKVYKVHHRNWNADLAVKSALPEIICSEKGKAAFIREAETWTNLGLHPHIVYCYYVRVIDGIPRVFAEHVKGGSLSDWIANGRLYEDENALARILDIAIQTAWGLHYAHEQGLIHQDVKPANVLMSESGMAKMTDFGIASAVSMADSEQRSGDQTMSGTFGGMTPGYCSPEQAEISYQASSGIAKEKRTKLTRRTDTWSWAAMVLEMFLGERTWQVGQVAGFALENYDGLKQSLAPQIPAMPDAVRALLARCFQKDEANRPENMIEIADELAQIYELSVGTQYPRIAPEKLKLYADSLNNRAVSYYDMGKTEEAEKTWDEALKDDPYHIEANYNLGLIRWRKAEQADDALIKKIKKIGNLHQSKKSQYALALVHLEHYDICAAMNILKNLDDKIPEAAVLCEQLKHTQQSTLKCLHTIDGHFQKLYSASISKTEELIVSSYDNCIKIWDVESGKCLRSLEGHTGIVGAVSISEDGRTILSGSYDSTLKLWDVSTGACLRTLQGHSEGIQKMSFNDSEHLGLSECFKGTVKLWDISTGQCLRTVNKREAGLTLKCFCPDAKCAVYSKHTKLYLWDMVTDICIREFDGKNDVTEACVTMDGNFILSRHVWNTFKIWDIKTGKCVQSFDGKVSYIDDAYQRMTTLGLSSDLKFVITGDIDGTLRIWNAETGRCIRTVFEHTGLICSACVSPDNKVLLSASQDSLIKLWSLPLEDAYKAPLLISRMSDTNTIISKQSYYERKINESRLFEEAGNVLEQYRVLKEVRTSWHESNLQLPAALIDEWAKLYLKFPKKDLIDVRERYVIKADSQSVSFVCLSSNGQLALTGGGSMKLWDTATGRCLRSIKTNEKFITACLSLDGKSALSCTSNGHIQLWDLTNGCLIRCFGNAEGVYPAVSISSDLKFVLAYENLYNRVCLFDVNSEQCLRVLKGSDILARQVCLSHDSLLSVTGNWNGSIKIWETATGKLLCENKNLSSCITASCISIDRKYVLSGSDNKQLLLWELETGHYRLFEGHTQEIQAVSMSADNKFALSASSDQTLRLWNLNTGQCMQVLEGHEAGVESACLSQDARLAVSVSRDGVLRIWSFDWEIDVKEFADWDDSAAQFIANFLIEQRPFAAKIPDNREPTEEEITAALTRCGKPNWSRMDFLRLIELLGNAGLGWLKPEGIHAILDQCVHNM